MLTGKKIGILLENRFIDQEIIYYSHRFNEEGATVEFLTRLWGQPELTFKGIELGMEMTVNKSFEEIDDTELDTYAAIIMPAGMVADMLRYAERPGDLAPAVQFIKRVMANKSIIKAAICHALWIFDPIPEVISGRSVTCHNNIIGSVKNTGANYVDQDIVIDDDLITARTGDMFAEFARTIIDELIKRKEADVFCYHTKLEKKDIGGGVILQVLGNGRYMNTLHWNMEDKSIVKFHQHPQEQFGYVIKGGFEMTVGDKTAVLKSGDAYFIPPNVSHEFIAVGETEAIDVFSPIKTDIPNKIK